MKFVSSLKTSVKILMLVAYTLVLILLSALSINLMKKGNEFEEYKFLAHDENIEVAVMLFEIRTPSKESDKNSREVAKWNARITLNSLDSSAKYKNVSAYLIFETNSGKLIYKEYMDPKETKLEASYISNNSSFNSMGSLKEEKNSTTNEFEVKDESPRYGYLTVMYEKQSKEDEKTWTKHQIDYKFDVIESSQEDFTKYESTTAQENKGKYSIDLKDTNKLYSISFEPKHTDNDYRYNFNLNYSKEEIGKAGINVDDSSIAVFAKVSNDKNDKNNVISDYIQLLHVYGIFTQRETGMQLTGSTSAISVPKDYKISELYILVTLRTESGKTTQSRVKLDIAEIENAK